MPEAELEIPYRVASAVIEEEPALSFAGMLMRRTKDELLDLARELNLTGYSKLAKADLAQAIATAGGTENADACLKAVSFCDNEQYDTFRMVLDQGGVVKMTPEELAGRTELAVSAPLVNVFLWEGVYTFVVYAEMVDVYAEVDWDDVEAHRREVADALQAVTMATAFCGLVKAEAAHHLYCTWMGHDTAFDDFLLDMVLAGEFRVLDFDVTTINDALYFEDIALVEESDRLETNEERELFDRYIEHILYCHEATPMRSFPQELRTQDPYEWKLNLSSVVKLQAFLEENRPAGKPETIWAEDIVMTFVFDPILSSDVRDQMEMIAEAGLDEHLANSPTLRTLLTAMNDELPQWENNGWSNRELRELHTGKKSFYNEDGTEQKVGRNDPCPCGSGKKYKKCCGVAAHA